MTGCCRKTWSTPHHIKKGVTAGVSAQEHAVYTSDMQPELHEHVASVKGHTVLCLKPVQD